ncbi:MAG: squalene/phytoene synthase family protein [Candidatus Dormibacteraeota bacterium]|nr:squalene/phytoene synthase family protein [Candidatus Dormibacteraeota bacterium]
MTPEDAYCRRLLRGHYENFWVAGPLVPRALRPDLARVYAYCRTVDDLGDESQDREDARQRLLLWQTDVRRLWAGGTPAHPVLVALRATVLAHDLPPEPFLDLVDANLQDQEVTSYAGWGQLVDYCRRSAAPVGRIVLHLFGMAQPELLGASDDVCIGLQLANFAQDVAVDRDKGRVYLPQSEIDERGLRGAVEATCRQARGMLHSGHVLEAASRGGLRVQLALYRTGGEAVLDAIQEVGYRTDEVRPTVSMATKVRLLGGALRRRSARGKDADEQYVHTA